MSDITFDQYKIDMLELACSRILSQFKTSTTGIQPYIDALVTQVQDWNDASVSVFVGRYLEEAVGVQLDILGALVGQSRPLVAGTLLSYFTFDSLDDLGWDGEGGWFTTNGPTTGTVPMLDAQYIQFIKAKIFKNQVSSASIPEIVQFAKILTNSNISVYFYPVVFNPKFFTWDVAETDSSYVWWCTNVSPFSFEPMTVLLIVPSSLTELELTFLVSYTLMNGTIDYFIPLSTCMRLIGALVIPDTFTNTFTWNGTDAQGWDNGLWAILVPPIQQ